MRSDKTKEGSVQEVQIVVEYIHTYRYPRGWIHMPKMSVWAGKRRAARSRRTYQIFYKALKILLSALMTFAVYLHLSAYAMAVRGYKAYGGECLAAVAAGILAYLFLKGGDKHGS